ARMCCTRSAVVAGGVRSRSARGSRSGKKGSGRGRHFVVIVLSRGGIWLGFRARAAASSYPRSTRDAPPLEFPGDPSSCLIGPRPFLLGGRAVEDRPGQVVQAQQRIAVRAADARRAESQDVGDHGSDAFLVRGDYGLRRGRYPARTVLASGGLVPAVPLRRGRRPRRAGRAAPWP